MNENETQPSPRSQQPLRTRPPGHAREADRDPRRRPRRPDRRLPAREEGPARGGARGGGPGRRHRQDRRPRRLPLRPRRAPLLHEGEGGRRPLARDHARGVPQAPAHVAHLLAQEVPRLPAARPGRDQEARPGRPHARRFLSYLWAKVKPKGKEETFEQWVVEPLRPLALQRVLQVLHREGVGRAHVRDPRRLGGPAHQGPVVLQRRQVGVLRQQGRQDQVADLGVQLPPLRPRPDVGDDDRRHPEARRPGAAGAQGHQAGLRGRASACACTWATRSSSRRP